MRYRIQNIKNIFFRYNLTKFKTTFTGVITIKCQNAAMVFGGVGGYHIIFQNRSARSLAEKHHDEMMVFRKDKEKNTREYRGKKLLMRCPSESCKSCCSKVENPCTTHVEKADATFPDQAPISSSPQSDNQSTETSSGSSSFLSKLVTAGAVGAAVGVKVVELLTGKN